MWTVRAMSALSGISIRTLHYYDEIGLLRPAEIGENGYRLYDEASLMRLKSILFFRELQFPLKEIAAMLGQEDFDPREALSRQITLMEMKRQRLERLIALARKTLDEGGNIMDFKAFDDHVFQQYAKETKERWGHTEAYQAYEKRGASDGPEVQQAMMGIFAQLGELKALSPAAPRVQEKIEALRQFITAHFYPCTKEILQSLGQMYTADERFRKNIDAAGGEGTAAFAEKAIQAYCGEK